MKPIWRVGVSPWAGVRPECLSVNSDDCQPGMEMNILQALANLLNVDLEFVASADPGCGKLFNNGTWTGLMGMLQSGEIDMIGNLCAMTEIRLLQNFSDYSYPVVHDSQHFLIKLPKSSYKFEVGAPFQQSLWVTIMGFWILFLSLHVISLRAYCKLSMISALDLSMREMFHSITGCDNQNGTIPILWNTWTIFLGFILTLYSMYITAALCRPITIDKPFSNSLEMSENLYAGEYKVISYKSNPTPKLRGKALDLFEKSISKNGFVYNRLAETPEEVKDLLDVVDKSKENLVFVHDKSWMYFYLQASPYPSKFWLIKDDLCEDSLNAYFYKKGFEMGAVLNYAIILIGDYKYNVQRRRWSSSKSVHEGNHIKEKPAEKLIISLKLINGPFLFHFSSLGISVIIVMLEIIIAKTWNISEMESIK